MRLIAYRTPTGPMMGAVEGDMVRPLCTVDDFYADVDAGRGSAAGEPVDLDSVEQVPPVPLTSRIFCIGLNYPLHIEETKSTRPDFPNLFVITGPQAPCHQPCCHPGRRCIANRNSSAIGAGDRRTDVRSGGPGLAAAIANAKAAGASYCRGTSICNR